MFCFKAFTPRRSLRQLRTRDITPAKVEVEEGIVCGPRSMSKRKKMQQNLNKTAPEKIVATSLNEVSVKKSLLMDEEEESKQVKESNVAEKEVSGKGRRTF